MSVVQNTLIGRARKKIGGSVFSTWKGINVLKSKPLTVANPRTPKQIQQRSAVSQITALYRGISGYIQLGFKQQAVRMSEFNAFSSYNLKNAIDKTVSGVATIIFADLLLSQGTITKTTPTAWSASLGATFNTIWDVLDPLPPGISLTDSALLVGYNKTKGNWGSGNSNDTYEEGTTSIDAVPLNWAIGDVVILYMFFYNSLSRKSSDSVAHQVTVIV